MKHAQRIQRMVIESLEKARAYSSDSAYHNLLFSVENDLTVRIIGLMSEPDIERKFHTWVDSTTVSLTGDNIRVELASIPRDEWEIEKIDRIKASRDELLSLLNDFYREVDLIANKSPHLASMSLRQIAERILLSPLENRPYSFVEKQKGIPHLPVSAQPLVIQQNKPCEICGENRTTDRCHIIPHSIGGTWSAGNILILCPTHHRLYDSGKLTKIEWERIVWVDKSQDSINYARLVIKPQLMNFWSLVGEGNYAAPPEPDIRAFYRHLIKTVADVLNGQSEITVSDLMGAFDESSLEFVEKTLTVLKSLKYLTSSSDASKIKLSKQISKLDEAVEEIIYHIELLNAKSEFRKKRR